MSVSCSRVGSALAANSAKARENVASPGTACARSQPHRRRNVLSTFRRSTNRLVVGTSKTALATKARAKAARSAGGRPGHPCQCGAPGEVEYHHEPLLPLAQRPDHLSQPGEKIGLKSLPAR